MADGDYYCNEFDLFNIFGQDSVERWSDSNNTGIKDASRIDWSASMSKEMIDGRFREGPYTLPFGVRGTSEDPTTGTVEQIIIYLAASMTGIMLYDTNRVVDSSSEDSIAQQRKNSDRMIAQIMKGQLKLSATKISGNYPFNVPAEAASGDTLLVDPIWINGFLS